MFGTTQRTTAGGRGCGWGVGGGGDGAGRAGVTTHGGVASVVAVQLTGPVVHPSEVTTTLPDAPRSVGNEPVKKVPALKLRLLIGSGVEGRKWPHEKVQMFPGTSVIRKLITPVQPGVTVRHTAPP